MTPTYYVPANKQYSKSEILQIINPSNAFFTNYKHTTLAKGEFWSWGVFGDSVYSCVCKPLAILGYVVGVYLGFALASKTNFSDCGVGEDGDNANKVKVVNNGVDQGKNDAGMAILGSVVANSASSFIKYYTASFGESDLKKDHYSSKEVVAMLNAKYKAALYGKKAQEWKAMIDFMNGEFEGVDTVPTQQDAGWTWWAPAAVLVEEAATVTHDA